ncbi:hypothetical protein GCM10010970_01210 [Silvimonas iriomotensis]|uniref:Uncharacterized protein n=1 Tax=Silvimonas iriomotensis TaxID=449662 RepID=A0ABQ2P485_9NEIS|nr:hypothetical protein GCM10010970_01210 [Silvimonas iriomotensis]
MRLSLQRALLGNITPNIRAITGHIEVGKIRLGFYFHGVIDDDSRENASIVETEVIADFDESFHVDTLVQRVDFPEVMEIGDDLLVYLRKE